MKFLKFLVVLLTMFGCTVFVYGYLNEKEVLNTLIEYYERNPSSLYKNQYTKEINVDFVKFTNDFEANNKNELINIYYTIMSSGMNEFTFYCSRNYSNCIQDIVDINNDKNLLSQINNFVHVFNSFKSIKTTYTTSGKINLSINRIYTEDDINIINSKLDQIERELYLNKETEYDKILAIHDYIINNTKYNKEDEYKENTPSSTAIGVYVKKLATCNGYTDAAALLLDRLNIPNVRISNDKHIWNLVYTNNRWLHLDLTWDDPINNLNKDILQHNYFLKTTKEFEQIATERPQSKHNFDKTIYNFVN